MENVHEPSSYTFSRRLTKIFHPLYALPLAIFILPIFLVPMGIILMNLSDDWALFGLCVIAFFLLMTFSLVYGLLGYTQDITYTFGAKNAACVATMSRNFGKTNRALFMIAKLAALSGGKLAVAGSIRPTDNTNLNWNIKWSFVRKIKTRPRYNYIKLKGAKGYLSVQIFCTKENFDEVLRIIKHYVPETA